MIIYNFVEIESLSRHGVMLPPNMIGLTEEQITDLKYVDEFEDICVPGGGYSMQIDPVGRRNGRGTSNRLQHKQNSIYN